MVVACIPTTHFSDEQAQPPQSIPSWRGICSAACAPANFKQSDVTRESPQSTAPSERDFPIVPRLTSPIGCSSTSTAPSSDEFESEESSDEGTILDGALSDGELTFSQRDMENLNADILEGPRLAKALTQLVVNLIVEDATQGGEIERRTSFHASRPPRLSIGRYIERFFEYFSCSAQCYVASFVYIDRVFKSHPNVLFNELSAHRLLLASLVVAVKFHDDVHHSNAYFANVGGVSLKSLNRLEKELLQLISWQMCISVDEYDQYLKLLENVNLDV